MKVTRLQIFWPEGFLQSGHCQNEWLTTAERAVVFCGREGGLTKTTVRSNLQQDVYYLKRKKERNDRPGETKSGKYLISGLHLAKEKDMGPSRAARVRITASHVSTMGTYPV